MNTPENREQLAELTFEVFGFKGMFIAAQALLAIISKAWSDKNAVNYTGIPWILATVSRTQFQSMIHIQSTMPLNLYQ